MKTPNLKSKPSKRRKWIKRILVFLTVIILLPSTLFTIGWFNRDRILDVLQEQFNENSTGTLSIGKVNASFISGFPNVGFTLKDIYYTNKDSITDQFSTLKIEQTKLVIGAGKLLRGNFSFKKIDIKNALFSSEVISKRGLVYHEKIRSDKHKKTNYGIQFPDWLNIDGATLILNNVKFVTKDSILHKDFNFHIHQFTSTFNRKDVKLNGKTTMDISVSNLGFNTKKGSFLKDAHVSGDLNYIVNLENDQIEIQDFPIQIDHQIFQLRADFDLTDITKYVFRLQNEHTDFTAVKSLLSDHLLENLKNYTIEKPIKSSIKIAGNFSYGNNPDINATFATTNNDVMISDRFHFKNTFFSGNLTNNIYKTDSLRTEKRSTKDFKLFFDFLTAQLETVSVDFRDSYFQSTPETINFFEANVRLNGDNSSLASIIETDNFDFKGGTFQLNAHLKGDIPNPYQFLNKATGEFNLKNTRVLLKKNGLQLPIQSIALSLERENAILRELIVNLSNGEDLVFKGTLKNISGLLSKEPAFPTTSHISLTSKNLNVNDVITMAKQFVPASQVQIDDRRNLHETLEAVYSQFHPQFDIRIGALKYNDVVINDLKSNLELIDSETIVMRNFNFNYDGATTKLKGKVSLPGPQSRFKDAIYLNAEAYSNGQIKVFKDLFNIELFRIDSGDFEFSGDVNGNFKEFRELLSKARGDLTLTNTNLYYEPAEMDIEIDSLSLFVKDGAIILKKFNLEIDEHSPITIDGSIQKFPNFLLDDIKETGSISLKVTAPLVDGDELLKTVDAFRDENKTKVIKSKQALRRLFTDIYRFNPTIELDIDSLRYRGLITENFNAQIFFENDSILKLNNLDLSYKETTANIHGEINAHSSQNELEKDNPFNLDFYIKVKGKSEDLNDYLKTSNFIFKSGEFEFEGNYKAQAKDLNLLNPKGYGDLKIGGTLVDYKAAKLQVPVDSLHLILNNDLATLKTLDIQLPGKSKLFFSGSIDHFSEFIDNIEDLNQHRSHFSIYSPYLDFANIHEFLNNTSIGNSEDQNFDLLKWKEAMRNINSSFYPDIAIQIDTLRHKAVMITDYESDLLFDQNGNFNIEDLKFNFNEGTISMATSVGIKSGDHTPIGIDMRVKNINLEKVLSSFNYFDDINLKKADSIHGILNYHLLADGTLDQESKINMESLNGTLELQLDSLAFYNYKPIMEGVPLLKDERFKNLRLRPIVQTFEIRDGEILIPQTEIQSSAIHLFVEGRLKLNDYLNVWLSVPWKNLKTNDGLALPEKTSYKDAGSKFFVQFLQDKNSQKVRKQKLKVKFKLGNRKLRKMRDR